MVNVAFLLQLGKVALHCGRTVVYKGRLFRKENLAFVSER
jgi:hypothetical protein